MEKPLIRFIIGGHQLRNSSFSILKRTIFAFKKAYGDSIDCMVCYNNVDSNKIDAVIPDKVMVYHQESLFLNQKRLWKYSPPRLRTNSHEIIVDNDVLLYSPIKSLDLFLERDDHFLMLEGKYKRYGVFYSKVKIKKSLNGGIVGFPPNFDLESKLLNEMIHLKNIKPEDEQGCTASLMPLDKTIVIPKEEVSLNYFNEGLVLGTSGVHFIGSNYSDHKPYNLYRVKYL